MQLYTLDPLHIDRQVCHTDEQIMLLIDLWKWSRKVALHTSNG